MGEATTATTMRDEFGDYSFFLDIPDIDEAGNVVLLADDDANKKRKRNSCFPACGHSLLVKKTTNDASKTNTDDDKNTKREDDVCNKDGFGDFSFLEGIVGIDETGKVILEKEMCETTGRKNTLVGPTTAVHVHKPIQTTTNGGTKECVASMMKSVATGVEKTTNEDEFGDDSFLDEIADIDANGNVVLRQDNTVTAAEENDPDNSKTEEEFGDCSFLVHIEIDEKGRVVGRGSEKKDSKSVAPRARMKRPDIIVDDSGRKETTRRPKLTSSQTAATFQDGSLPSRETQGAATTAVANFWDVSSWGSPRRSRKRAAEATRTTETMQSPTSVVLNNPYRRSDSKQGRLNFDSNNRSRQRPRTQRDASTPNQQRKPERFIVYV